MRIPLVLATHADPVAANLEENDDLLRVVSRDGCLCGYGEPWRPQMSDSDRDAIKNIFSTAPQPQQPILLPDPADVSRMRFEGIAAQAWEHPLDRAALNALRKVPGFDAALKKLFGAFSERSLRLLFLANAVKVGPVQFARINAMVDESCAVLDMKRPDVFIAQNPIVNAGAIGVDDPFIVLNSSLLDLMDDEELRFVIGHELGHIKSDHALYKTMLRLLLQMTLGRVMPVAGLAILGLVMALREWDRKSELSADRAGLLASQRPEAALSAQMKMAGGGRTAEMNLDAFIQQAEDYNSAGDARDSALRLLHALGRTHPFPVVRLAELKKWAETGSYRQILAGNYPREDDEGSTYADVSDAAESYREKATDTEDPLARLLQDIGSTVTDAGAALRDFFTGKRRDDGEDAGESDGQENDNDTKP